MVRLFVLAMLAWNAMASSAGCQEYPSRPVRVIVPTAAGSGYDFVARLVSENLQAELGQAVIVENRVGAVGQIAAQAVIASADDGYTFLYAGLGDMILSPALKTLPYDAAEAFRPVSLVASFSFALLARNDLPESTISDLIRFSRANPGKRTIGHPGLGSGQHIASALLKRAAGMDLFDVQYRSGPAMYADLLGGRIDMFFDNVNNAMSQVESGNLKALMVTAADRAAVLPGVPTASESGIPAATLEAWSGFFARSTVPDAIATKVGESVSKALRNPALVSRLRGNGWKPLDLSGPPALRFVADERVKWPSTLRQTGVSAE